MPFDGSTKTDFSLLDRFDRAIALIENPTYWCKGEFESYGGRRCMLGALQKAGAVDAVPLVALELPRRWRIFRQPLTDESIIAFNDALFTSHADVMRVMRRARDRIAHSL